MLKAFGNMGRVVKSEKTCFTSYMHTMFWATILYKDHDLKQEELIGKGECFCHRYHNDKVIKVLLGKPYPPPSSFVTIDIFFSQK